MTPFIYPYVGLIGILLVMLIRQLRKLKRYDRPECPECDHPLIGYPTHDRCPCCGYFVKRA